MNKQRHIEYGGRTLTVLSTDPAGAIDGYNDWMNEMRAMRAAKSSKVEKALPKKDPDSEPVAFKKPSKASKKQAGKNGKVRSSYPDENAKKQNARAAEPDAKPTPQPDPIPVPQETGATATVDPAKLANQLGMSVATLQRVAQRFVDNKKLNGRKGFIKFMATRLKDFTNKHKLDGDFYGLTFDALTNGKQ